jgi:ankyrin repeat protein
MYDITRLLLDRNADGAHVSCYGWNPVVYLLEGAQKFEGTRAHTLPEFLDILNHDRVHVDTDAQDQFGQNALQLAAAWYPGGVIGRLFTLGASLSLFGHNPWRYPANPIWNAIYSNNTSSFQVLLPYYPDMNAVDSRQLRMLNYTARNGNVEMTELLLEMGAEEIFPDYNTQDNKSDSGFDADEDASDTEGLEEWTEENYLTYLNTLERFGRIVIRTNDAEDGENRDIYWNANEYLTHWY